MFRCRARKRGGRAAVRVDAQRKTSPAVALGNPGHHRRFHVAGSRSGIIRWLDGVAPAAYRPHNRRGAGLRNYRSHGAISHAGRIKGDEQNREHFGDSKERPGRPPKSEIPAADPGLESRQGMGTPTVCAQRWVGFRWPGGYPSSSTRQHSRSDLHRRVLCAARDKRSCTPVEVHITMRPMGWLTAFVRESTMALV